MDSRLQGNNHNNDDDDNHNASNNNSNDNNNNDDNNNDIILHTRSHKSETPLKNATEIPLTIPVEIH